MGHRAWDQVSEYLRVLVGVLLRVEEIQEGPAPGVSWHSESELHVESLVCLIA